MVLAMFKIEVKLNGEMSNWAANTAVISTVFIIGVAVFAALLR